MKNCKKKKKQMWREIDRSTHPAGGAGGGDVQLQWPVESALPQRHRGGPPHLHRPHLARCLSLSLLLLLLPLSLPLLLLLSSLSLCYYSCC